MTALEKQPGTAINTRSGKVLDFANPSSSAIDIEDVAGGLAMAPRFGGQALHFHSVAQHAVNVSLVVAAVLKRPDLDLVALHHDSHEAYACDLPKPLKNALGDRYRIITGELDRAIAEAFDFDLPKEESAEWTIIKQADDALFVIESAELLTGQPLMPRIDPEIVTAARDVVDARGHWGRERAELSFRRAHQGCVSP